MNDTGSFQHGDSRRRFQRRLRRFSGTRRGLRNAALAYRLAGVMLAGFMLLLVLPAARLDLPLVDAVLFLIAAAGLLALAGVYLVRRRRYAGDLSEAFQMEALAGDLNSRLISALDFLDQEHRHPLMDVVIVRAGGDLERTLYEERLDRAPRNRARRRCLGLLALTVVLGISPWFGFGRLALRATVAWAAVHERLFPTEWVATPAAGRHVHLLGDTVDVTLRFTRHGFDQVVLVEQAPDDGAPETRTPLTADAAGMVRTAVRGDSESVRRLHFEFGRRPTRTDSIELVFTTRPVLENMQIELMAPAYTRQPPRDLEGIQTAIAGLPGTRVTLGMTFSKPLARATLRFDGDPQEIPLDVVGRFAALHFVVSDAQRARIQIEDVHGFDLRHPHSLDIDVLTDELPRMAVPRFLRAEMPAKAEALKTFGFGVRAWDDYGVARTVLKWRQATLENRQAITAQGEVERLFDPPLPSVVAEFENVFADLDARPGDLIEFQIEVVDNREPQAQIVSSATFSFFIHQDDLDGMGLGDDLMFGSLAERGGRGRIARARISTDVAEPRDLRTVSEFRGDYEADVRSASRPPAVRGDFGAAVERYFQVLSTARFTEDETQ